MTVELVTSPELGDLDTLDKEPRYLQWTPVIAGWMLQHTNFGWPLVCAGAMKATYDLLLLAQFRDVRPNEAAFTERRST